MERRELIERDLIERDIGAFLALQQKKDILRLLTAGSVDDGKSTLIGRLLFDSSSVYDDQVETLRKDSAKKGGGPAIDYSLLVDGLLAEREQGITIDVAYRYFATPARKFIIADTPGHEQYTRNMATGASTADLAIILVDARQGVLPQTRRHSTIASLLGIRHVVLAINKMDLVGWDPAVFSRICEEYLAYAAPLGFDTIHPIPLSALEGDNVVFRSDKTPYYAGAPLLDVLETVKIDRGEKLRAFRFPVQLVLRPNLDFRGFAGTIAAGAVAKGDLVRVLPSGHEARVRSIVTFDGELEVAEAPLSVTLTLDREVDVSRGDLLVRATAAAEAPLAAPEEAPHVGRSFEATVVWMHERPLRPGSSYLLKHTTRLVPAEVTLLEHRLDVTTLAELPAESLGLNDIGRVVITTARPLVFDAYARSRATGAFVLVDRLTNATVGAGMILALRAAEGIEAAERSSARAGAITAADRARRLGQEAVEIELTGPMSEVEAFAVALERRLLERGLVALFVGPAFGSAEARRGAIAACQALGVVSIAASEGEGALGARARSSRGGEGTRSFAAPVEASGAIEAAAEALVQSLLERGLL